MPPTDPARRDDAPWTEEDERAHQEAVRRWEARFGTTVEEVDESTLTEEDWEEIRQADADFDAGRCYTTEQVRQHLEALLARRTGEA